MREDILIPDASVSYGYRINWERAAQLEAMKSHSLLKSEPAMEVEPRHRASQG